MLGRLAVHVVERLFPGLLVAELGDAEGNPFPIAAAPPAERGLEVERGIVTWREGGPACRFKKFQPVSLGLKGDWILFSGEVDILLFGGRLICVGGGRRGEEEGVAVVDGRARGGGREVGSSAINVENSSSPRDSRERFSQKMEPPEPAGSRVDMGGRVGVWGEERREASSLLSRSLFDLRKEVAEGQALRIYSTERRKEEGRKTHKKSPLPVYLSGSGAKKARES